MLGKPKPNLIHLNPEYLLDPIEQGCTGHSSSSTQRTHGPWNNEGFNFRGHGFPEGLGAKLWKVQECATIDLAHTAADFYLLDGMAVQGINKPEGRKLHMPRFDTDILFEMLEHGFKVVNDDTLDAISTKAYIAQRRITNKVAPVIRNYCHYAIAGELSYSKAMWEVGCYHNDAQCSWFQMCQIAGADKCCEWAEDIYFEKHNDGSSVWSHAFGGAKWGMGTKILHLFETGEVEGMPFGNREFLDRVLSLQHNTGSFLNKVSWSGGLHNMGYVLNAHNESDWATLANYASIPVAAVFKKYWALMNEERVAAGEEPASSAWKSPYSYNPKDIFERVEKAEDWETIDDLEPHLEYVGQTYCTSMPDDCDCGLPRWQVIDQPGVALGVVAIGKSLYRGTCRSTGQKFDVGTEIIYHGKGMGASIRTEWEAKHGVSFKHPKRQKLKKWEKPNTGGY